MSGPLSGIRVLDLTSVLMGPYATQIMGDLGADVIKIESRTGDTTRKIGPGRSPDMGSNFLHSNRSKRSVVLDLKQPEGREALLRLAAISDVLIHNIRKPAMERLGLGYESVKARNEAIVYCTMTGFGEGGPYSDKPAYDDLVQGLTGLPAMIGGAEGVPRYVPTPLVDRIAGLNGVIAVTSALLWRSRSSQGQAIDVPMFECMAQFVLSDHLFGETFSPPLSKPGYNRLMSDKRRPFGTEDGWICMLTYTDRHWLKLFDILGRNDLAGDVRFKDMRSRNDHIDELYGIIAAAMPSKTTEQWLKILAEADIPAAPLNDLRGLIDDPHLEAVNFFEWAQHPTEGPIKTIAVPTRWSLTKPVLTSPAPRLGQHSVEVLHIAGYDDAEIDRLCAAGITAKPDSPTENDVG